jgi:D-glycerate 3-kinase
MAIADTAIQSVLEHIIPLIEKFKLEQRQINHPLPFKLLLSGLQGSGKSTWAAALAQSLQQIKSYKVVVVSLDDFYHAHNNLVRIRTENSENKMLWARGQPGTHDEKLAQEFFASFGSGKDIRVPFFDKSQYNGEGDRAPYEEWDVVKNGPPVDVLIFEGWCVGFQFLSDSDLEKRWSSSSQTSQPNELSSRCSTTVLQDHSIQHIRVINNNLRRYNETFMNSSDFNYLIHLDTEDLANVYRWRLNQEHALHELKGRGMTDEAVIEFVRGYMPAYELYLERLKMESFIPHNQRASTQLRVVLDINRTVVDVTEL